MYWMEPRSQNRNSVEFTQCSLKRWLSDITFKMRIDEALNKVCKDLDAAIVANINMQILPQDADPPHVWRESRDNTVFFVLQPLVASIPPRPAEAGEGSVLTMIQQNLLCAAGTFFSDRFEPLFRRIGGCARCKVKMRAKNLTIFTKQWLTEKNWNLVPLFASHGDSLSR